MKQRDLHHWNALSYIFTFIDIYWFSHWKNSGENSKNSNPDSTDSFAFLKTSLIGVYPDNYDSNVL